MLRFLKVTTFVTTRLSSVLQISWDIPIAIEILLLPLERGYLWVLGFSE